MNKILILLAAFTMAVFSQSPIEKMSSNLRSKLINSANEKTLVWVFFTDKGANLNKYINSPESLVSKESLQRRAKVLSQDKLVDFLDIPVFDPYVEQLEVLGFKVSQKTKWFNGVSGYANAAELEKISRLSFVSNIDLVALFKKNPQSINNSELNKNTLPNNTNSIYSLNYGASLTQNQQINVPALHDQGIKGQGVRIAVFDAGFNNLAHQCFVNMNIAKKRNFVNNDTLVNVSDGDHGTETLSTIGGFKEGSLIGPAYMATFFLARTEVVSSETPVEEQYWVAAVEWADSLGADVISSSLGYTTFDPPYTSYTWQNMNGRYCISTKGAVIAMRKGIVVVNSAGNDGDNSTHNTLGAPSDADSIITAGAVGSTGTRSSFSSVGPTADGRIKPDVMAMGSGVTVASPYNVTGYTTASGTSFSCPLTAGVAALILCKNPNLTPVQVRDAMRFTGSRSTNPDKYYGWGIINAVNAANYWPLPVELISFTGNAVGDKVFLNWKTASENNNKGFEIQRRLDNNEYVTVGFVSGFGTSTTEKSYSFTDQNFISGNIFYRLKQIDFDGAYKFSNEINIQISPNQYSLFQNYPNPFNPSTTIRYSIPVDSKVKLSIYNIIGNEIESLYDGFLSAGTHEYKFDGSQLASGIYFVKMTSGTFQQTIKIALTK